jgi:hypothetical protein
MASKTDKIVGAPTVEGSVGLGAGDTVTLYFVVTPDWPNDRKIGYGHAFENGKFKSSKFVDSTLNLAKGTTYQDLEDVGRYFDIKSIDTATGTASRVNLYVGGKSAEGEQVASFIIEPGVQIETLKKGYLQWHQIE